MQRISRIVPSRHTSNEENAHARNEASKSTRTVKDPQKGRRSQRILDPLNNNKLLTLGLLSAVWVVAILWLYPSATDRWIPNHLPAFVEHVVLPHAQFIPKRKPKPTQSTTSTRKKEKPLNILLLYADDWRWDSLGVQGNPFVKTPFLDKLAKKGVRFERNMVTTSICWMSRGTLHTGLYASKHKGWTPDQPHWYRHWYDSFPSLMKEEQNYAMAHVGKWDYTHFYAIPELYETYNYSRLYHAKHWYSKQEIEQETIQQTQITGQPRYDTQYKTHLGSQVHITDRTVAESMEFLKHRPEDQPFMLTVAFFPPHSVDGTEGQFFPQPETASYYPSNVTILPPVPPAFTVENMNQSFGRLPDSIFHRADGNEARERWHLRFDNVAKYNAMMKRYYQMITGVDQACETLVQELERQGILNDTLVVFTTDNGFYHGEHGLAGKWFPHEESIRVPLIIMDPRAPSSSQGTVRDEMTLNIDLAPTLLSAAQTSIPSQMQGRDISQLYRGNKVTRPFRDEFFYEHPQFWDEIFLPASTALVRKTHKYIRWGSAPDQRVEQLFDLTKDPNEETDVSTQAGYASILREMRQRHDELQQDCCVDVDTIGPKLGVLYNREKGLPRKDPVAETASELQDWQTVS